MTKYDENRISTYYQSIGIIDGCFNKRQKKLVNRKFPTLNRDIGACVLSLIYRNNASSLCMLDDYAFAGDSLYCEWCYVIDLDVQTFEIYKGFNEIPLQPHDRFYPLQYNHDKMEFYPVRITMSYSLKDLPTIEEFLNNFNTH